MTLVLPNRIPHRYFLTKGSGSSDITQHAGSYHLALRDAGIEMCNIMVYSSILPGQAEQIDQYSYTPKHGEVMECIMAVSHCTYGEHAVVGLGRMDLFKGESPYGGLVVEFSFRDTFAWSTEEIEAELRKMLDELYTNGYEHLRAGEPKLVTHQIQGEKKYNTALIALCFTDHLYYEFQDAA